MQKIKVEERNNIKVNRRKDGGGRGGDESRKVEEKI